MAFLDFINKNGSLAEWISAIVAILALLGVGFEYANRKRLDRLQLAQEMIDRLTTDEMLLFATTVLDWGTGILIVPEAWRDVVKSPSVAWNLDDIQDALKPGLTIETRDNPVRLLYRHAFVQLFNHLERMGDLLRRGALDVQDLGPLADLANQLKLWDYASDLEREEREKLFLSPMKIWYPSGAPKMLIDAIVSAFPKKPEK